MGYLRDLVLPRGYRYYDTPEGQDCGKKLWYVAKECAVYGVLFSSVDVLMYSHPKGYGPTLARYAYITLPVLGMGATFVVTTCMATNFRKKDDEWNYFCGGASLGSIIGAWQKSLKWGIYSGAALGLLFALRKQCLINNWTLIPDPGPQIYGSLWSIKRDYTILPDPGKTWKVSADE